ncbi:MAG: asparagine synthase (glutamine-hydrolyzing) [Planctomycetaceae bacterium]
MCGILGAWTRRPLGLETRDEALEKIQHRGPDDEGRFSQGGVFLGMRRLAVVDLESGRQPLFNERRTCAVVMNGEIYNYRELAASLRKAGHRLSTESDTEVAVHLYEDHGESFCNRLNGMFSLAIWDGSARRLILARDRFGKKPLYYARTPEGGLVFASELKALRPLLEAAGGHWELRPQGIADYLSLGCVPQPETVFRGVEALPPGCTLTFDGQKTRVRSYWSLPYTGKQRMSYPAALERTRELVAEAVRSRLHADVPLGVFLSGGVDSSVIACEAAKLVGSDLQTFTVAVDDPRFDESDVAARTAEQLGTRHTVLPLDVAPRETLLELVRHYDQPFADPSAIPSLAISRLARQHVTVVLNGDGGDEIFAGYRRHLAAHLAGFLDWLPGWSARAGASLLGRFSRSRRSGAGFAARMCRGLSLDPPERYLAWTTDRLREIDKRQYWLGPSVRSTEEWLKSVQPEGLGALDTQTATDIRVNLLSGLLVKMDMATMAHSLEGRSPLLDHRVAEFVALLPPGFRLRGGRLKSLLRDGWRDELSSEVIDGKKRGFEIPLDRWLAGDLNELLMDTLGSPTARLREFLDGRFLDRLLAQETLAERNWPTLVYSLLVLELWLQTAAFTERPVISGTVIAA